MQKQAFSMEAEMINRARFFKVFLVLCFCFVLIKSSNSDELGVFRNTYYYLSFEGDYADDSIGSRRFRQILNE